MALEEQTLSIAADPPYGAAVVVHRRRNGWNEFLMLHRADGTGEWTWEPPSGLRYSDETVSDCAQRQLIEEAGLDLACVPTEQIPGRWPYYLAQAPLGAEVRLSDEHDRFVWVPLGVAVRLCSPSHVANAVERVGRLAVCGGPGAA